MTIVGEELVRRVCEPVWRRYRVPSASRTLLALDGYACDLPRPFAARFDIVLDFEATLSDAFAARARHIDVRNVHFGTGRVEALLKVPDDGVDVCFSATAIDLDGRSRREHRDLLAQFARVLKPGGLAHFRLAGTEAEGFGAVLRRWMGGRDGRQKGIERRLKLVGLAPLEWMRTLDGETWIVARKPWR